MTKKMTPEELEQQRVNLGIETKQAALEFIIDVADDYDNCKTADQLKELVDEIAMVALIGYTIKETGDDKKEKS